MVFLKVMIVEQFIFLKWVKITFLRVLGWFGGQNRNQHVEKICNMGSNQNSSIFAFIDVRILYVF